VAPSDNDPKTGTRAPGGPVPKLSDSEAKSVTGPGFCQSDLSVRVEQWRDTKASGPAPKHERQRNDPPPWA
jgi:hypothetical protein